MAANSQEFIQTSDGDVIEPYEVLELFEKEDFERLEYIAAELRRTKALNLAGAWHLHEFYRLAPENPRDLEGEAEEAFLEKIGRWEDAYPNSVTWRLFLARTYERIAWRHRGGDFATNVTDEGWKGFRTYLLKDWEVLLEAEALPEKDPELYALAHEAVLGLGPLAVEHLRRERKTTFGYRKGDSDGDLKKRIFEAGVEIEPLYYFLYYLHARSLQHRWGGKAGELEGFMLESAQRTKELVGDALYARIYWYLARNLGPSRTMTYYRFDWPRLEQGYLDSIDRFPDTRFWAQHYNFAAVLFNKKEKAKELFGDLDEYHAEVWRNEIRYNRCRDWALDEGDYPFEPRMEAAIMDQRTEALETLLDAGADPNRNTLDGHSMLYLAINHNNPEVASLLLQVGADVSRGTVDGFSPLHSALYSKNWDSASILLKAEAEVTNLRIGQFIAKDESGEQLAFLLREGVDPHQVNQYGGNFLHFSAMMGNVVNIRMLLKHGMDVDSTTPTGETPILFAAGGGHADAVEVLIENGADLERTYYDNWTVLEIAQKEEGHTEVLERLVRALKR